MSKEYVLMRDLITKHHPKFVSSKELTDYALQFPDIFKVERLVEESLAHVGGYNFVDEEGRDFDDEDNSDSKTGTVNSWSCAMDIGSVENKYGSIRLIAYNPRKDGLDYFYIPKAYVQSYRLGCYGKSSYKQRLRFNWNEYSDHYNKFERFRVEDFKRVATLSDKKFLNG